MGRSDFRCEGREQTSQGGARLFAVHRGFSASGDRDDFYWSGARRDNYSRRHAAGALAVGDVVTDASREGRRSVLAVIPSQARNLSSPSDAPTTTGNSSRPMRRRAACIYVLAGKSGRAVYPTSNLQTRTRRGTTNGKFLLNGEIGGRFLACARNNGGADCG